MNTKCYLLRSKRLFAKSVMLGVMSAVLAKSHAQSFKPGEELQRALVPAVRKMEQDHINNHLPAPNPHQLPLLEIARAGRHLFNTPFTKLDGAGEGMRDEKGEGVLGPREKDYNDRLDLIIQEAGASGAAATALRKNLAPATAMRDPADGTPLLVTIGNKPKVRFDFLRVNGLDSQSCFECHNSIGSEHLPGQGDPALLERKVGVSSGPAGFASNAFIGENLDVQKMQTLGEMEAGKKPAGSAVPFTKLLRNPPHVFGTGYVQKLAEEMTFELHLIERDLLFKLLTGRPPAEFPDLESKGVSFGKLKITYKGSPLPEAEASMKADELASSGLLGPDFDLDESALDGVSEDLVVRPFQWKGIASDERNFVRAALSFHFGMQPRELNPGIPDEDMDGHEDEVLEGEVSALTLFTMLCRPPSVQPPSDDTRRASAERGRALFGILPGGKLKAGSGQGGQITTCASCHRPHLTIEDSIVSVRDPRAEKADARFLNKQGLTPVQVGGKLPVLKKFSLQLERWRADKSKTQPLTKERLLDFMQMPAAPTEKTPGYYFDLSLKSGEADPKNKSLSFSYPRLKENAGGSIDVPLFSDLKRHHMGEGLADGFDQSTDRAYPVGDEVVSIKVERHLFLTRSLWGVADSGPWMHDGRARTLREAIDMHKSPNSEASVVVDSLSDDQKKDVIEFLLTLRLPREARYSADDNPDE